MKIGFIFSGQGAQYLGMGKELCEAYPKAKEVFDKAEEALGFSIYDICCNQEEKLNETEFTQPAILTVSIAALAVLKEKGIEPAYMAGLSLGEYSALVASGAMDFSQAVALVQKRGRFMTEAVPKGQGGMAAILGLSRELVQEACDKSSGLGYVAIANYNAPGQIVIAGEIGALEEAGRMAKELGAKMVVGLNVSGPFHTPLLQPASERLAQELANITIEEMHTPVITNLTGQKIEHKGDIIPVLIEQIKSPVRWEETLLTLSEAGVDTFVEIGPGKALSGFVKRTLKGVTILNVEDSKSLEKTIEKLCI